MLFLYSLLIHYYFKKYNLSLFNIIFYFIISIIVFWNYWTKSKFSSQYFLSAFQKLQFFHHLIFLSIIILQFISTCIYHFHISPSSYLSFFCRSWVETMQYCGTVRGSSICRIQNPAMEPLSITSACPRGLRNLLQER